MLFANSVILKVFNRTCTSSGDPRHLFIQTQAPFRNIHFGPKDEQRKIFESDYADVQFCAFCTASQYVYQVRHNNADTPRYKTNYEQY